MLALFQEGLGEIAARYGLGVAIAAAALWFLAFKVWPWMTRRVEVADEQREKNIDRFASQIELLGNTHVEALRELTTEIKGLRDDVREPPRKTR